MGVDFLSMLSLSYKQPKKHVHGPLGPLVPNTRRGNHSTPKPPSKHSIWVPYGIPSGSHMGPTWDLQPGSRWVPYGLAHIGYGLAQIYPT